VIGVLTAVRPLVEGSADVSIDEARLADVASWLAYEELPVPPVFLPFRVPPEQVVDFVLVTSCLNFAYTDFTTRERWDLVLDGRVYADADGLHAAFFRAGPEVLRGEWLASVTPAQLGEILPGLQMLEERAAILNEVGATLLDRWDGRFANVVDSVSTVQEYLDVLIREFPRFDDEPFYKLAQLSAWILHIEGAKRWPDVDTLTAFADYIVPMGLRAMGIIRYSEPLAAAIDSWTPIEAGSSWEVEIRAATVWVCHLLAEAVTELRPPELKVIDAQIDARYWFFFHKTHAAHHLTRTIYY
jgi:hypothetical protein